MSYNRLVERLPGALVLRCCFLVSRVGRCSGLSFIDSTQLSVCHNRRIGSHKVMAELAARGKTSGEGFYGFKLHLLINNPGEWLGVKITAGNVDDRDPVPELARALFGKLLGERGYLSQALFEQLWERRVQLITKLRMSDGAHSLMLRFRTSASVTNTYSYSDRLLDTQNTKAYA